MRMVSAPGGKRKELIREFDDFWSVTFFFRRGFSFFGKPRCQRQENHENQEKKIRGKSQITCDM